MKASEEKRIEAEVRRLVGTRMGMVRESMGLDQDAAGALFGIRGHRWGYYERGDREPPLWLLRKLPQVFHRPLSWFFDLPDERGLDDDEAQVISLLRAITSPPVKRAALAGMVALLEAGIRESEREGQQLAAG